MQNLKKIYICMQNQFILQIKALNAKIWISPEMFSGITTWLNVATVFNYVGCSELIIYVKLAKFCLDISILIRGRLFNLDRLYALFFGMN